MNEVDLGAPAFWLCIGAGMISGSCSWWSFRRYSDPAKVRVAANRIIAHLFEFRLFADEPRLIFRAQRDLLIANAQLLRDVAGSTLLILIPFAALLIALDGVFARAPLEVSRPAIVTVHSTNSDVMTVYLHGPPGIRIETPPVRIERASEIAWRIRPIRSVTGDLQIDSANCVINKRISSKRGLQWLSKVRTRSLVKFVVDPFELPFSCPAVSFVSIDYPRATIFNFNWAVWFSLGCFAGVMISALRRHER